MQTHLSWHIDLSIDETGSEAGAVARLKLPDATEMSARGHSNRHPDDPLQTLVGEELATARALNDLAHQLLRKAAHEIEEKTHAPAHPHL
ncbi:DUF1876 domain-containing protein [Streptomyces sp. NPDC001165]|uniref:DUF1876 domain-containing protein n=1 Tax=Streptomyces sp. NPDC001165 TaxID=3364546 RepID=UPI00369DF3B4